MQGASPTEKGAHTVGGEGGAPKAIVEGEGAQAVKGGVTVVMGGAAVTGAGGTATTAAAEAPAEIGVGAAGGGATAGGGARDIASTETADVLQGAAIDTETEGVTVGDARDSATGIDDAKLINIVISSNDIFTLIRLTHKVEQV